MTSTANDFATIEREIYVDASPEVVYEVVSKPEHIVGWWTDDAVFEEAPGGSGFVAFGDIAAGGMRVELTVAEAIPPRLFAFRWTHQPGEVAAVGNSNLVTFKLEAEGSGTRVKFTELGFVERGWDLSKARQTYADHSSGWDQFLPRLSEYAEGLSVAG